MTEARFLRVRGVVQGVGFRPFVYRLARENGLAGWVLNAGDGVEVHAEGDAAALEAFARAIETGSPPAALVASLEVEVAAAEGFDAFTIRQSALGDAAAGAGGPTVRISPDLPVCADCLAELADPGDRRRGYPYVNCTNCGPRYSIVLGLPYDRARTTMKDWPLCEACAREYGDPGDRRFHAQPVACPACGPHYRLEGSGTAGDGAAGEEIALEDDAGAIAEAVRRLKAGEILAVKGLGGYHLACDAGNAAAVAALRERKFRKEKPFALMVSDLAAARRLVELDATSEELLASTPRPIVLAPAKRELPGVAPGNRDLGVMLPYTPLHHLLFAAGAPEALVLTSANRSSEPIAYRDGEARERLAGIADAFLMGERPIARRVDDSVARADPFGPTVLRRSRGWAPGAAARLPLERPVLGVGADLKNTVTLVVGGEAFVSQHVGDLAHFEAFQAFRETIDDLLRMYEVDRGDLLVVCDLHPEYASTRHASELAAGERRGVQHHRAHVAAVAAERGALGERVVGVAFDGTGYGDDGAIWGGEFFVGSVREGFERAAHLRTARLPGGDAAARHPVQAAAGFLAGLSGLPDLTAPPFAFPGRYGRARTLVEKGVRTFPTTSAGRLFDTAAALLGFTRETTFEGQAAVWLEHLARGAAAEEPLPFPFAGGELDWGGALAGLAERRFAGEAPAALARAFHRGLARGLWRAVESLAAEHGVGVAALSGGVFQNRLLLEEIAVLAAASQLEVWTHREVPPNDGGISLGQVALALGPA